MAKAKTTTKTKTKKSADDCYDDFMKAVQKAEDAKTDKTRAKWVKSASAEFDDLMDCADELSASQLRRAKRTKKFLTEMASELDD